MINKFDPKETTKLFGLQKELNFLFNLYKKNKLPKVLLISGNRGTGKSTLINHLIFSICDKDHYDFLHNSISNQSNFYNMFTNDLATNIFFLSNSRTKVSIEDIRDLKNKLSKSSINNLEKFIILDDIDKLNLNCVNALLKIIEEPTKNNYFILIDNKSKTLVKTLKSRTLEIKILINNQNRLNIIKSLIQHFNINPKIEFSNSYLTPGLFLVFNGICEENKIDLNDTYLENLKILLNLYSKNKENIYVNLILHLTDLHFEKFKLNKIFQIDKVIENKNFVIKNLNNFFLYNINQKTLINAINDKIK